MPSVRLWCVKVGGGSSSQASDSSPPLQMRCTPNVPKQSQLYDDDDDAHGDDDDDDDINLLHCHLTHLKAPYLPLVGFHLERL